MFCSANWLTAGPSSRKKSVMWLIADTFKRWRSSISLILEINPRNRSDGSDEFTLTPFSTNGNFTLKSNFPPGKISREKVSRSKSGSLK